MKILITGRTGLAAALAKVYQSHSVTCVSRSTGHDINDVASWGSQFLDHDIIYNCAYDGSGQLSVLEFFYADWKTDPQRTIVNIGSRIVAFPRSDGLQDYTSYHTHKKALLAAYEMMLPTARCDIKMINPGPIDTKMVEHLSVLKLNPNDVAHHIKDLVQNPLIKRVDLWL